LLILAVCVGLGLVVVVWLGVDDARQTALLDARVQHARIRALGLQGRWERLMQDGAPEEEVVQAARDADRAWEEAEPLCEEQREREKSWPARLRWEVRRRTGW
jgi:hypothetical protein